MDFIEKIKSLCISRGTTIKALEKELGFSNGSIAKNGVPNSMRLYKIAKYFDVPMECLLDDKLVAYRFDEHDRLLSEFDNLKKKPLYRASAGQGAYNADYVSDSVEDYDAGFEYAKVIGDSMVPVLNDGDIVKIQPTIETSPHDLTVVKINGDESTIKYIEVVSDGIWLKAENKDVFEDKFFTIQEVMTLPVTIIGKVVELRRKFK